MKKFLILSAILGLAGLGVSIAGSQSPESTVVESAADAPTTSTTTPAAAVTTSSTVAKVATKAPAKAVATTTTRPPAAVASSPTTTTTATQVTTTTLAPTTTTTALAAVTPTCTVAAAKASVGPGETQTISVTSNMPTTKVKIEMAYPKFGTNQPNPRQTYTPTTDAAGSVTQSFMASDWSTAPATVRVQFYKPTGVVGPLACSTSFMSTES